MTIYGLNDNCKSHWFPASVLPTRPGYYEVGHAAQGAPAPRSKMRLIGKTRYFDGGVWLTGNDKWDGPTIFGQHASHQWRGLDESAYRKHKGRADNARLLNATSKGPA